MDERAKRYKELLSGTRGQPAFEKVQRWFEITNSEGYEGHDADLAKIMKLESVTVEPTKSNPNHAQTIFSFTVPAKLCNMTGNLHGGAVALIFDICTSTCITAASREDFWDTGHVSRTRRANRYLQVNCTYLRPAPLGSKIYVVSEVVHLGKKMGQSVGTMRLDSPDGKICYTCEHGKAAMGGSSL